AMLARGGQARGLAVTVYGPAQAGRRFFPGAPAFVPVEIADRPRPAGDAAAGLRLRKRLAGSRPGVVHAHGLRAGAVAAFALAGAGWRRRHRCALVVTVHNAPPTASPAGAVYAVLERIVAHRADAVTCVSGDLAARMRHLGTADVGLAIVPAPPGTAPGSEEGAGGRARPGRARTHVVVAGGRGGGGRRGGPRRRRPAGGARGGPARPPEGLCHAAGGRGQLAAPRARPRAGPRRRPGAATHGAGPRGRE